MAVPDWDLDRARIVPESDKNRTKWQIGQIPNRDRPSRIGKRIGQGVPDKAILIGSERVVPEWIDKLEKASSR